MLSNSEEFQHLPTVDDDDPMAEPGMVREQAAPPALPPVHAEPEPTPAAYPEPAHASEIAPQEEHAAIAEPVPAAAPAAERVKTVKVPAASPVTAKSPAPEAKTQPAAERVKTAKVPVLTPAAAAPVSTAVEAKARSIPPPPPLQPAKVKTQEVSLPAKTDTEESALHTPEIAAHLDALKAVAKSQAEAAEAEAPPKEPWHERWEKWGGRSLAISVGAHLLLLIIAAVTVFHHVTDKQIDFLPGGSSVQGQQAQQALQHKIQQKKNPWLKQSMPSRKIAVASSMNNLVLPKTEMPDVLDLPQTSKPLGGGAMSGGFGLAGAGGGFGSGVGLGAKNGMVFGPLFGLNIKAKKLAVVLDVSYSMTPHLERVVKEVDKVAKGSVVVLYFGCGLAPPPKALAGTKVFKTSTTEFEKFWRLGGATYMDTAKFKIDKKEPIPNQQLFLQLSRRPQTYFIHSVGVEYAWLALLSDEVRNADGLYWFCDFQDTVEFKQLGVVLENLQRRKQRLYIHSYGKGQYFDLIKNQLVEPTKGDSYVEE